VCGILKSGPSGTQHCSRKKGEGGGELNFNLANAAILEIHLLPTHDWVTAVDAAGVAGALFLT
jgi:hypothetical protein